MKRLLTKGLLFCLSSMVIFASTASNRTLDKSGLVSNQKVEVKSRKDNPTRITTPENAQYGTTVKPDFIVPNGNYIVVHGYKFQLDLYNQTGKLLKTFPVAIGQFGMGKQKEGDRKTPIGTYQIIFKASSFANQDGGYFLPQFKDHDEFEQLKKEYWMPTDGGNEAVAMVLNYPNSLDRKEGKTGDSIMIHSTLMGGIGSEISGGCMRMNISQARELYREVQVGTKVIIQPN